MLVFLHLQCKHLLHSLDMKSAIKDFYLQFCPKFKSSILGYCESLLFFHLTLQIPGIRLKLSILFRMLNTGSRNQWCCYFYFIFLVFISIFCPLNVTQLVKCKSIIQFLTCYWNPVFKTATIFPQIIGPNIFIFYFKRKWINFVGIYTFKKINFHWLIIF